MPLSDLLDDRIAWKVCESVHLGMDAVYLPYVPSFLRGSKYGQAGIEGILCFTGKGEPVGQSALRYVIAPACAAFVREHVLPSLPPRWWEKRRPWMCV